MGRLKGRLKQLSKRMGAGAARCATCGVSDSLASSVAYTVFSGYWLLAEGPAAAEALDEAGELFLHDGTPAPPPCPACGRWPTIPMFYSRSYIESHKADNEKTGDEQNVESMPV